MANLSDFAIICDHRAEKFGIVNNNSHLLSFTDESESTLSDNLDIEFGGENGRIYSRDELSVWDEWFVSDG